MMPLSSAEQDHPSFSFRVLTMSICRTKIQKNGNEYINEYIPIAEVRVSTFFFFFCYQFLLTSMRIVFYSPFLQCNNLPENSLKHLLSQQTKMNNLTPASFHNSDIKYSSGIPPDQE